MNKRHILICGPRRAGKSTLMEKLLAESTLPLAGFFTRSTPRDENGFHQIYLHPAGRSERSTSAENHIGDCNGKERSVHPEVFETLGTACLRHDPGDLIAMDEIGFMETAAPAFCAAVMDCLDGENHVLACVKARFDVPFLDAVRNHPNASVYWISEENRDTLFDELLPVLRSWNR